MLSIKQKFLKVAYPFWVNLAKLLGINAATVKSPKVITPPESIYQLAIPLINGKELPLSDYRGQKILFVNTASNCGYTGQYEELKKLEQQVGNKLKIVAFPANDFKEQEKGSDEEIQQFCSVNFGIDFPLAKKSVVIKNKDQNKVYQWLTNKNKNGWNDQQPKWNFSKYLVNENGALTHYFDASVSPLSDDVLKAVNE